MPEGHTIHALARRLDDAYVDSVVAASSPQGRFVAGAALVDGSVWQGAEAHGKHLLVDLDLPRELAGTRLHVHLGLFGRFSVRQHRRKARPAPDDLPVRGQVRLRLVNDTHVGDLRGPTACTLVDADEVAALLARLGPDPLRDDADPEAGWRTISRSRRSIGALLMDQSVIAGVGNVYRAEVLHRARLDPFTPGRSVPREVYDELWSDLVRLMAVGVEVGSIVTREDDLERTLHWEGRGRFRASYEVYRRAGQPCRRCGGRIRSAEVVARTLTWCPGCQVAPS